MTAQTPERDTSAEALGRINYEAGLAKAREQGSNTLFDDWEHLEDTDRERCEAGALAVAAHVVDPTAEDFDNAAEIMRLAAGEHPAVYARWVRADYPDATDAKVARLWKAAGPRDRQFWAQIVSERREDRAELENQVARGDRLEGKAEDIAAEHDKLAELLGRYERITTAWARGMYSARIDCLRGDVRAAIECLSEGLDGYDGTEWNGTETGTEWWERTKAEEGL